jgi:cytosine deaminase
MDALERAGRRTAAVYRQSVILLTLSPCARCSGAILLYGIGHVVVGEIRRSEERKIVAGARRAGGRCRTIDAPR